MKHLPLVTKTIAILLFVLAASPAFAKATTWTCAIGDTHYLVSLSAPDAAFLTVDESVGASTEMLRHTLPGGIVDGGLYYRDKKMLFTAQNAEGTLILDDRAIDCPRMIVTVSPPKQGSKTIGTGQSLGGKLRSGPGITFAPAGRAPNGTKLTIIRHANLPMNGYDWFQVKIGARKAYLWGGIMCSDVEVKGIPAVCN